MARRRNNGIITGWPATWVKLRAGIRLLRISFRAYRNPFHSLSALRMLLRQRTRLHGNRKDHKIVRSGSLYYWSIYTPGFPSHAFDDIIRREIQRAFPGPVNGKMPSLQTLILAISSRCKYHCEHCFEATNMGTEEHLTVEELVKIMEDAVAKGIRHIQFGGGEPMMRFEEMIQIMKHFHDSMEYWISTSGYGFTLEKALEMKAAGMTGANISLDDYDRERHDRFRGAPGAFDLAIEAVHHCHRASIIPNLTLCVTRPMATRENLMKYLHLARELDVPFVRFLEPRKIGSYAGKDVLLRAGEQRTLLDLFRQVNSSRKFRSYPIVQYPGYHQRKIGCFGAGNRYLYINAKGDYQGCPFCEGSVGNFREMNLAQAIDLLQVRGCQLFKTNHEV
jgi:MoaA/NifB/PqqE/SkfB family radical SAM enzyme